MGVAPNPNELVQPLLVSTGGTHEQTVTAAARAASQAWLSNPDAPSWEPWFAAAFAKTVRRVRPELVNSLPTPAASVMTGPNVAYAYTPMRYADFPSRIAKAQVQGTDLPRLGWHVFNPDVESDNVRLVLNPSVADAMSTGKTAAQAAHALMIYLLHQEPADRHIPRFVVEMAADENVFKEITASSVMTVRDQGRTEIEPGTVTFVAVP